MSEPQPAQREPGVDGCVVRTAPLSAMLQDFVTGWRRDRPSRKGRFGNDSTRPEDEPLGAYEALSTWTGLPESQIRRVTRPLRYPLTELRVADALVASIGADPMVFGCPALGIEATLHILPNPSASPERRSECCGGSTNTLTGA